MHPPLSYVIPESLAVAVLPPVLVLGKPHATAYCSIEGDMIACLSHRYARYKLDNDQGLELIEPTLPGPSTSVSITQFHKSHDGHAAYGCSDSACWKGCVR